MVSYAHLMQGLLALTFVLLTLHKRNNAWWVIAFMFAVVAGALRLTVPVDEVRDYAPYLNTLEAVKRGSVPTELLFEPYRLGLLRVALLARDLDSLGQMRIVYYVHFLAVTGFFLWLAYAKDIHFVAKIVLFLGFYPTMAFVWLQGGIAYAAACFLPLVVSAGSRLRLLHYAPALAHASAIPFLAVMKAKDLRPVRRALVIAGSAVVGYLLLGSSYAEHFIGKLDRYASTNELRTSVSLLLFHTVNVGAFVALTVLSPKFRRNRSLWILVAMYAAMYILNPVVGLRLFPFVLIGCIVQRVEFPRHRHMLLLVALAYVPVYVARFDQITSI